MFSDEMPDDELLTQLKTKYERTRPGDCPVCGAHVVIEPHGGGYPLPWVCPVAKRGLDAAHEEGASQQRIDVLQAHVAQSRWEDFRQVGDRRVMELIRRYEALKQEYTQ